MFRPNSYATLLIYDGTSDVFGKKNFLKPMKVRCAVILYDVKSQKTSVRADTSASRGQAQEIEGLAKFLFPKTLKIKVEDRVIKDNFVLDVIEVFPRYNVLGVLDHYEVDLKKVEENG